MSERMSSGLRASSLGVRRRRRRRLGYIFFGVLIFLCIGAGIWGVWQNSVRIADIEVQGGDPALSAYAERALTGTYAGIIPRNSIFFFPARSIRAAILAEHPDIAAVSISRKGLTGIVLTVIERTAIGTWCGLSPLEINTTLTGQAPTTPSDGEYCYVFDASGYIFSPSVREDVATGSTTEQAVINTFNFYAPLAGNTEEPLRATLAQAELLPSVFDFARQFSARIVPVRSVVLVGDEVHFYLASGARLLYVLGEGKSAFGAVIAAEDTTDFSDETIEYIDVRFEGKVYLKRKE